MLFDLDVWKNAQSVFIYVSVTPEPDTRRVIDTALKDGKRVAIPKTYQDGSMRALLIDSLTGLNIAPYGIPEPPDYASELLNPDLVIIPCLACDEDGNRIGHGAGYYDRYLAQVKCPCVCLCPESALFKTVPHDDLDIKPDIILSERRLIRIEKSI